MRAPIGPSPHAQALRGTPPPGRGRLWCLSGFEWSARRSQAGPTGARSARLRSRGWRHTRCTACDGRRGCGAARLAPVAPLAAQLAVRSRCCSRAARRACFPAPRRAQSNEDTRVTLRCCLEPLKRRIPCDTGRTKHCRLDGTQSAAWSGPICLPSTRDISKARFTSTTGYRSAVCVGRTRSLEALRWPGGTHPLPPPPTVALAQRKPCSAQLPVRPSLPPSAVHLRAGRLCVAVLPVHRATFATHA